MVIIVFSSGLNTLAQRPDKGTVEFAMLGGISILDYEGPFGSNDSETYFSIPSGSSTFPLSSMMRMSFWTRSQLVIDLGFSFLNISDGGDLTAVNIEGGIGGVFGESDAKTFPFAGAILGVLSISNGDTESEGYIGFQGGFRHFFLKHAAMRMQVAYRKFLGDEFNLDSSLEVGGGLSFFI
jgi:hypothetical protein